MHMGCVSVCVYVCICTECCVCIWIVYVHMEWWVCIGGLCVCIRSGVYGYGGCVCAYRVVSMHTCIIWLVRSFLIFLWRCSFLSGH